MHHLYSRLICSFIVEALYDPPPSVNSVLGFFSSGLSLTHFA